MKKITAAIVISLSIGQLQAQNVGIGTTSPHASAALHVNSTTRGFLPPRMTSAQRNAIASPQNGLMVYDTDTERLYTVVDGTWRYVITNELWANSATSVYNTAWNVGIGTAAPQEKLHILGNIRLSGTVFSSEGLSVNNADGIITFQNASVDKAFVQLSNDNLRVGTFSPNSTGQFIVRTGGTDRLVVENGGNVGISNTNPAQRLDVTGNINLSGKVMRSASTSTANMLPVAYGKITASGTLYSGTSNFTITSPQTGVFTITSSDFTASTVVIATPTATNVSVGAGTGTEPNTLTFYLRHMDTGELVNAWFNFVAFTY